MLWPLFIAVDSGSLDRDDCRRRLRPRPHRPRHPPRPVPRDVAADDAQWTEVAGEDRPGVLPSRRLSHPARPRVWIRRPVLGLRLAYRQAGGAGLREELKGVPPGRVLGCSARLCARRQGRRGRL